jgi:ribosomal protein L37AE/L43A
MPRKRVRVREHDRRKPHQDDRIHVDDYNRVQDVNLHVTPGAAELGPTEDKDIRYLKWSERSEESRQNERECEDCGQVRDLREMIQMPDGAWYCQPCAENIPDEEEKADIDEETEQIEAIEKELHGKDHELESGWKKRGMKLLTQADREKLPKLYGTEGVRAEDKVLRVKFFTPTSNWTWYAVEFDGDDTFFGYVEGFEDEWGYFSLRELSDVKGPMGVGIERDKYWEPTKFGDYIAQKG